MEELADLVKLHYLFYKKQNYSKYLPKGVSVVNEYSDDDSMVFNTARLEALELDNLLEIAEATAISAEGRRESRGAHARDDFQTRDDENWLCHSIFDPKTKTLSKRDVNFDPKTVPTFEPMERTY